MKNMRTSLSVTTHFLYYVQSLVMVAEGEGISTSGCYNYVSSTVYRHSVVIAKSSLLEILSTVIQLLPLPPMAVHPPDPDSQPAANGRDTFILLTKVFSACTHSTHQAPAGPEKSCVVFGGFG